MSKNIKKTAVLIIAHGSREKESNEAFLALVEKFRRTSSSAPEVVGAFLEISSPDIPTGIEECLASGAREIFIIPLMIFSGRHVTKDIPAFIQEARTKHNGILFHYGTPLADQPLMLELLKAQVVSLKKSIGWESSQEP